MVKSYIRRVIKKFRGKPEQPKNIKQQEKIEVLLEIFRRKLEKGEPFLPRIIHVETRTRCNGRCHFCVAAAGVDPRPDFYIQDSLIDKILEELKELDFPNRLSFYNNNEPFLDKRIPQVIGKARSMLPRAYLELKTNGRTLTMEKILEVFDNGLDILYVSDYRSSGEVEKRSYSPNIEKIRQALEKTRRFKGHYDGKRYFNRIIISLRKEDEILHTRAGSAPNRERLSAPLTKPCLRPFEMMTIGAEGQVGICSENVFYEVTMGNITKETILSVWTSPAYNALRKELLKGNRGYKPTCSLCDYRGHTMEVLAENGL